MVDIDAMTSGEWLNYRDKLLDDYYKAGNVLVPDPECKQCDPDNDYVCFECECIQIENWRNKMTDIEKLNKAKDLLDDVYTKYGNLLKDNYSICSPLSCADGCIIEAIEWLEKFKKEIA